MPTLMLPFLLLLFSLSSLSFLATPSVALTGPAESERLYLSGVDAESPTIWQFRMAGETEWSEAPVPGNWELSGYGTYAYGHDEKTSSDVGVYRVGFSPPAHWDDRQIDLVFEGVMTDTEVHLNGQPLEPIHHGGFTEFSYPVDPLLEPGFNTLRAVVRERSGDRSVNAAERKADYWVFGGIYRPVYLEAHPRTSISDVAIHAVPAMDSSSPGRGRDATARLTAQITTRGATPGATVVARVVDASGRQLADGRVPTVGDRAELELTVPGAQPWSAARPALYFLVLDLTSGEGGQEDVVHRVRQRFGFRSLEVRTEGPAPGFYVNGRRTLLRGVNRHSFWPTSGRALSRHRNRADVELIKSLNLNAARSSHYPPDREFLEACDELGLYVIDELPGWHDAYRTGVGRRLVEEMVRRDRSHPSVVLWANGNEGGWNRRLDALFTELDPQRRAVLHPDDPAGGFDAGHYPTHNELVARLGPVGDRRWWQRRPPEARLTLPTEWLHGLFDGGGGAGLERYWELIASSQRGAGGFLWMLADEGVVRTDRGGEIDVHGNFAPDGLVGPFREPSGSATAVREILAPLRLDVTELPTTAQTSPVELPVVSRWNELPLESYRFEWRWLSLPRTPSGDSVATLGSGTHVTVAQPLEGPASRDPTSVYETMDDSVQSRGMLVVPPPTSRIDDDRILALELRALTPGWSGPGAATPTPSRELMHWVLPEPAATPSPPECAAPTALTGSSSSDAVLSAGGTTARFDPTDGRLVELRRDRGSVTLSLGGEETAVIERCGGDSPHLRIRSSGALEQADWLLDALGDLHLWFRLRHDSTAPWSGLPLGIDRDEVEEARWLGGGPYPVWGNRLAGARFGVWTASGEELAGARSRVRWAHLDLGDTRLTITLAPISGERLSLEDTTFLSLGAPSFPEGVRFAHAELPAGVAILTSLPPIGTKFHPGVDISPPPTEDRAVEARTVAGYASLSTRH